MKLKNVLTNYFEHQDLSVGSKTDFESLEKSILARIKPKQKRKFSYVPVSLFIVIILLVAIFANSTTIQKLNKKGANYAIIQKVSAEGILRDMQASINSEHLHFTMHETSVSSIPQPNSEDEADSLGAMSYSETWIDRKNHVSRLDRKDSKGRTRVLIIIKGLSSQSTTYQFITSEQQNLAEPRNKAGYFVTREDHDGYESNIDLTISKDYINLVKERGLEVDPKYKEINYQGHPAYEITLQYAKHKLKQASLTEIFTIDKETKLPYERLEIVKGAVTDDDISQYKTIYSFSTNFSDDVFDLRAPEGYSLMQNPKITGFYLNESGMGYGDERKTPEDDWKFRRVLSVTLSDGINTTGGTRGGLLPVGYTYRLFIAKKIFQTEDEAQNAKGIEYEEVKPHESDFPQNNYPNQVYTLPEIAGNTFDPNQFVLLRLEVTDKNGNSYDVKQIIKMYFLLGPKF